MMRSTAAIETCSLLLFTVACAGRTTTHPPESPPISTTPAPSSVSSTPRTWTFAYEPGISGYTVKRTAIIEDQSDSLSTREVATNLAHELLTLERIGDTIQASAVADTFAIITQGLLGPPQPVSLPIRVNGSLTHDGFTIAPDSTTESCNPPKSAVESDLHDLVATFPEQLTPGITWRDSVELKGCQGMIPTTANIERSYTVLGEADYNGIPVVAVERQDSIRAHGEGAQQQHQITIDASGSGTALEYLSTSSGRIVSVTTNQELSLAIRTSGQVRRFRQTMKQELTIER
jgi:hypothetical protein